jgi:hypothetical protein
VSINEPSWKERPTWLSERSNNVPSLATLAVLVFALLVAALVDVAI